ncbi:MAG: glycosyltransferase family 4 protein [Chitinophagales bacterium]
MNILILNYEYPPLGGGAGIVTQHLANEFILKSHSVTILTTWFAGEPEYHSENNLTIIRVKSLRKQTFQSNPFEMYDWLKKAKQYAAIYFKENQFDVCLANFTLPGGAVAHFLQKKIKLPYVILSHGHDIPWFSPQQMLFWHLLCFPYIRYILSKSSYNVLLTQQLKENADSFLGKYKFGKNKVIPNGLLANSYRKGFDATDKIIQALFVGRLVPQKDPITVIKSFQQLQKNNLPIHLKIIGDGTLKEELERYISTEQLINIELLGKISQSQVMEEYEKAHILIAPSREEAMSLSVLEAISCGLYIFATKVSGNSEIIRDQVNGSFIPFNDANVLAEKITVFYKEKFLQNYQYPEQMPQSILQDYSWENSANKYLELFEEMKQANTK